jgi:hypothetical protein
MKIKEACCGWQYAISAQHRRFSLDAEEEMLSIDQVRYRHKAETF